MWEGGCGAPSNTRGFSWHQASAAPGPCKAKCPPLTAGTKNSPSKPQRAFRLEAAGRGFQEASALAGPLGSWRLLARLRPMLGSPRRSRPLLHRTPQYPQPLGRVAAARLLLLTQPSTPGPSGASSV